MSAAQRDHADSCCYAQYRRVALGGCGVRPLSVGLLTLRFRERMLAYGWWHGSALQGEALDLEVAVRQQGHMHGCVAGLGSAVQGADEQQRGNRHLSAPVPTTKQSDGAFQSPRPWPGRVASGRFRRQSAIPPAFPLIWQWLAEGRIEAIRETEGPWVPGHGPQALCHGASFLPPHGLVRSHAPTPGESVPTGTRRAPAPPPGSAPPGPRAVQWKALPRVSPVHLPIVAEHMALAGSQASALVRDRRRRRALTRTAGNAASPAAGAGPGPRAA